MSSGVAGRFVIGADAFIFVYAVEDPADTGQPAHPSENRAFSLAIERVRASANAEWRPAAIALTKADRLRYVPPIDRWLRRPSYQPLDAGAIREESGDIYAYIHHNRGTAALAPFGAFARCTLHAVSATGGDAVLSSTDELVFPRGVRPTRVLEPLVSILAMTGVIGGDEAALVGTQ